MSFCVVYYEMEKGMTPAEEFILAQDSDYYRQRGMQR